MGRGLRIGHPVGGPGSGIDFPLNVTAGSDIRLLWDGANLLPRTSHTAIWLARYVQQTGYYAVTWHSPNTGSWDGGAYSYGAHPFPCDGAFNSSGQATGGTGGSGTVHYFEQAGIGAAIDWIASSSSPGPQDNFLVVKDVWYQQARTVEVIGGTTIRHTFWPDIENEPTKFIRTDLALGSLGSAGSTPAFYLGASDWRAGIGGTGRNDETVGGVLRGIRLFDAPMAIADIQAEIAAIGNNTAASTAGIASVWYINDNPTPTDVTDKSGAGHSPTWANANRPTLWEPA